MNEFDVARFKKDAQWIVPRIPVDIRNLEGGISKRFVTPVRVWVEKRVIRMWADAITGTLYTKDGYCLSTYHRRIEAWYP